jgi:hypothetical protein
MALSERVETEFTVERRVGLVNLWLDIPAWE